MQQIMSIACHSTALLLLGQAKVRMDWTPYRYNMPMAYTVCKIMAMLGIYLVKNVRILSKQNFTVPHRC